MVKVEVDKFGDIHVNLGSGFRTTVAVHYNPPYVWIEKQVTKGDRAGRWNIIAQLNGDQELVDALRELATALEKTLGVKK